MLRSSCRQHVLFSEPLQQQRAEGSGGSEDVQSNVVLPADGAAGTAAAARAAAAAAAAAADDLVSCAPLPSDAARSAWAGPPPGVAEPSLGEAQPAAAQPLWQQPLTVDPACGSAGAGGSGAGTGHATQTGVSLGVPSLSGGAGAGSQPLAGHAPPAGLLLRSAQRAEPSAGEEVEGAQAVAGPAPVLPQPQAATKVQEAGGQGSSSPGSGACTAGGQQAQQARGVPGSAACAQQRQHGQAAPSGHKRQRARSPSPPPDDT